MHALLQRSLPGAALLTAVAALAPVALAQSLLVVDANQAPGTDFASITAALAAASDGDTLLVRAGSYGEDLILDDRELTIVADGEVALFSIDVRNLSANKHVTLRGLDVSPQLFGSLPGLRVADCEGRVFVDTCSFLDATLLSNGVVVASDADALVFTRCIVGGGLQGSLPAASFNVEGSKVAFIDSTVYGGDGQTSFLVPGQASNAIRMFDSRVTVSGSTILGGDGADGYPLAITCQNGGSGAAGILISGPGTSSKLEVIDSVVLGGIGGDPNFAPCVAGASGAPIDNTAGAAVVTQHAGAAPHFTLASPLRSGELLDFELTGPPNAQVLLLLGLEPGLVRPYDPVLVGVGVVGAPELILPYFPIPPDGSLDDTDAPGTIALPPGFTHLNLVLQHVVADPVAGLVASTPVSLLVLDPAF